MENTGLLPGSVCIRALFKQPHCPHPSVNRGGGVGECAREWGRKQQEGERVTSISSVAYQDDPTLGSSIQK